jgi:hypothetical protein
VLKNQYKALMIFNSQLMAKLKNHYEYLKEIENERLCEIESLLESKCVEQPKDKQ